MRNTAARPLLWTWVLLLAASFISAAGADESKPNILYIVVDNVAFEHMGKAYGGETLTPAMDRIAEQGALMERMYVPTPLCIPSRYSILSGRYPERCSSPSYLEDYPSGQQDWDVRVELETDRPNLPKGLQAAGYTTGFVGKFHSTHSNAKLRSNKKWDGTHITAPEVTPELRRLGALLDRHIRKCGFDWVGGAAYGNGLVSAASGIDTDGVHHNLEWEVHNALEFLDRQEGKDEPFFLYFSTRLFHLPVITEKDFLTDYSKVGRYTERGVLEQAPEVPMPSRKEIVEITRKEMAEAGRAKKLERDAIAMRALDYGVKAVLDRLKAMGAEENTIVVFVSDNNQSGKSTVYEGGIHVPASIRWPGVIKPGTRIPRIVSTLDVAVTLLNLAETRPDPEMQADGKSFLPMLKGEESEWDDVFLAEYNCAKAIVTPDWKYVVVRFTEERQRQIDEEDARKPEAPDFSGNAVKMRKWKAITQPKLSDNQLPRAYNIYRYWSTADMNHIKRAGDYPHLFELDQLYDLKKDPGEQVNLASDPDHAGKLAEMQALMRQEVKKLDRPFAEFSEN